MRRREHGGSTLVEFTLVGIPMIFVLFSTFEMARGMWIYHSLAFTVKEATRYASVHGVDCTIAPNSCGVKIADIATVIQNSAPGLIPSQLSVTFSPVPASGTSTNTLDQWLADTTDAWPPSTPAGANAIGAQISISAVYPFQSGIAMLWPGAGTTKAPGRIWLPASSTDRVQF